MLLIAAACGKRGGGDGGTSVGSGSAVLTVPRSAELPAGLVVTVLPTGEVPAPARGHAMMIGAHYKVVAVVEVGPPTAKLAAPSPLAITIDPARIFAEYSASDVTAAQLQADGAVVDLPIRVVSPHRLDVTIDRAGIVMLFGPLEKQSVLGTAADILRGSTVLLVQGDCPTWITPASPRIAALAKDPAGLVIGPDHTLGLGAKLADGRATTPRLHADEILARGTADAADASVVLASLLLAKGHPVRLVSGTMMYDAAGRRHAGVQQWAEVVLEGAPWFVDARDLAKLRLIPLAAATTELKLGIGRTCPSYPPGASTDPGQWTPPSPPSPPPPAK